MAGHDIIEKAQTHWLYTLVSFPFLLLFGAPKSTVLWRVSQRNFQSHIVVIACLPFMPTSLWRLWSLRDLLVALFKFIEIVNFFSGNSWKKLPNYTVVSSKSCFLWGSWKPWGSSPESQHLLPFFWSTRWEWNKKVGAQLSTQPTSPSPTLDHWQLLLLGFPELPSRVLATF